MTAVSVFPEQISTPNLPLRKRGTWEEFWDLLKTSEYRVEYHKGEIILEMSYEPDPHSKLANRFGHLFELIFDNSEFEIFNSNRPVYITNCESVFNPDATVVQLPKELYTYQPGMTAEVSPIVIAEVLSPSTRDRDFVEKLPCYKQIPSVRYILYAELTHPMVYLYERDTNAGEWRHTFFDTLDSSFELFGKNLALRELYKRIEFPYGNAR